MASMFSTRDPAYHQALRRPVSQKFSMSSIKTLEPFTDECTEIFIQAMKDLEGKAVDLGTWLQWYAFDVIGAITFQRRFGFMEKRTDIQSMIGDLDIGLQYAATVGQIPELHPWLLGSLWVTKLLNAQPFLRVPDPLRNIVKVGEDTPPSNEIPYKISVHERMH
jgi:Cytochrome P450